MVISHKCNIGPNWCCLEVYYIHATLHNQYWNVYMYIHISLTTNGPITILSIYNICLCIALLAYQHANSKLLPSIMSHVSWAVCVRSTIYMTHRVTAYIERSKSVTYEVSFQLWCCHRRRQLGSSLGFGTQFICTISIQKNRLLADFGSAYFSLQQI